jgi:hypothetical protein
MFGSASKSNMRGLLARGLGGLDASFGLPAGPVVSARVGLPGERQPPFPSIGDCPTGFEQLPLLGKGRAGGRRVGERVSY